MEAAVLCEGGGQIVGWARSGELTFELQRVPPCDIESAWQRTDLRRCRLVIVP
jgi:hypothetical protein